MDTEQLAVELYETYLVVICEHHAWASVQPARETWECAAGWTHPVVPHIAAIAPWNHTIRAWKDLHESQHPALLAEFRRCQRELLDLNQRFMAEIAADLEVERYRSTRSPLGQFADGFFGYFGR